MTIIQLEAELALAVQAELGEGPVWDERSQELYFVDITGHRVHAFAPASGAHRSFPTYGPVGAVVLRDDGGLVLAAQDGFFFAHSDGTGLERFGEFRIDSETVRFNDGKVGPGGHFLAGTMDHHEELTVGSLYILKADAGVSVLLDPVSISNGLAWDADGTTVYYIDTPTHRIDAFSFDQGTGEISDRRVVAEITDAGPDSPVGVRFGPGSTDVALTQGEGIGKPLTVTDIPPGTSLHKGEILTTSGLQDAAYPALIPVAEITGFSSTPSATEESVTAVPLADLSQLEYVDVLQWPVS